MDRESSLLLLDSSFWVVAGVDFVDEDIEERVLCFPDLFLAEGVVLIMSAVPFPFDNPFCLETCTKPLCFLEELASFLISSVWGGGVIDVFLSERG